MAREYGVIWKDERHNELGRVELTVNSKMPLDRYYGYYHDRRFEHRESALNSLRRLQSAIIMQDELGLRCSSTNISALLGEERYGGAPQGFDHSRAWYHPGLKQYLITTEPYGAGLSGPPSYVESILMANCDQHKWFYSGLRAGIGFWNPGLIGGTRLYLITGGKKGVSQDQVAAWAAKLSEILPVWLSYGEYMESLGTALTIQPLPNGNARPIAQL